MATAGPMLLGDYLLTERVGEGGMAEVYMAQYMGSAHSVGEQNAVVVKRIKPALFKAPEFPIFREMFLNEAKLLRSLQHANLARFYSLNEAVDKTLNVKVPFIVSEYVRGSTLWELLRMATLGFTGRGISPAIAAYITREIARGLGHAHAHCDPSSGRAQPIIHRDISPENVMVSDEGKVKVIDFGVAKAIGGFGPQTQTGIIKGKLAYMAPEQVAQKVVPATDVFGAGIVLWEMLTGRRLFAAPNEYIVVNKVLKGEIPRPSATTRGIPKELEEVVMTALTRDLAIRYRDGNSFADALTEVMKQVTFLRGVTANSVKRWADQTVADGKKIASSWSEDSSDSKNQPVPGSNPPSMVEDGQAEIPIELTGDDLVLGEDVDPGVRAAVTQAMRTLTPAMLQRRPAPTNPLASTAGESAPAASRSTPPPPPPPRRSPSRSPDSGWQAVPLPPSLAEASTPEQPVAAVPAAEELASAATAENAPIRHRPALTRAASSPRKRPLHRRALRMLRSLLAALQHYVGDAQTARWLGAVAGLALLVLVLFLLVLIFS